MKIRILAISAALVSALTAAACSFGPDAYNGTPVCPGDPPPDTVMVPDGECWDGGGLPPDAGMAAGGADTAGGGGADATGGAAVAGGAGSGGAAVAGGAGTGGASTAGTGG